MKSKDLSEKIDSRLSGEESEKVSIGFEYIDRSDWSSVIREWIWYGHRQT